MAVRLLDYFCFFNSGPASSKRVDSFGCRTTRTVSHLALPLVGTCHPSDREKTFLRLRNQYLHTKLSKIRRSQKLACSGLLRPQRLSSNGGRNRIDIVASVSFAAMDGNSIRLPSFQEG